MHDAVSAIAKLGVGIFIIACLVGQLMYHFNVEPPAWLATGIIVVVMVPVAIFTVAWLCLLVVAASAKACSMFEFVRQGLLVFACDVVYHPSGRRPCRIGDAESAEAPGLPTPRNKNTTPL